MGCGLVSESSPHNGEGRYCSSPETISDKFYEYLPFYLSIGMTYDQFWNEDSTLVKHYRKAHELKQKQRNQSFWLQGLYFYEALCDVAPTLKAFSKAKPTPYCDEPFPLTDEDFKARKERQEEAKAKKMMAQMEMFRAEVNSHFQEEA